MTTEIKVLPGWIMRDTNNITVLSQENETYTMTSGEVLAFTISRILAPEGEFRRVVVEDRTSHTYSRLSEATIWPERHGRPGNNAVVRQDETFTPLEVHFAHGLQIMVTK